MHNVSLVFGVVTMMSGIVGVPLGSILSTKLKQKYPRADPVICAFGLLTSAAFLAVGLLTANWNIYLAFFVLFLGEVTLNLNWSIVADILLYVVVPTRRSTAEALQILISHALGDAGSPYLIGIVSTFIHRLALLSVVIFRAGSIVHHYILSFRRVHFLYFELVYCICFLCQCHSKLCITDSTNV